VDNFGWELSYDSDLCTGGLACRRRDLICALPLACCSFAGRQANALADGRRDEPDRALFIAAKPRCRYALYSAEAYLFEAPYGREMGFRSVNSAHRALAYSMVTSSASSRVHRPIRAHR
jgi:hypothetical protein